MTLLPRCSTCLKGIILTLFCLNFNQAWSNSSAKNSLITTHPKVGLVLAGGGARGLAHIGVIKALEERNIRIDSISGTSMGALIGGLYASGLSIKEIEAFAMHLDWEQILNDNPPRHFLSFRRKQDQYDYFIPGEIGMNYWKLLFPSGLLQGQQQYNLLEGLIINSPSQGRINDFSQLPIPFTAVATDIESGDTVLLQQGNLARALRASMSVPGVFAPVKMNNHLLVDGGLTNNTPIDVVRAMGAEIVIVSDIHTPKFKKEDLNSFVAISDQIISSLTTNNTLAQLQTLKPNDIHIKPQLDNLTASDFSQAAKMIALGYSATTSQNQALSKLAQTKPRAKSIDNPYPPIIHQIQIKNRTRLSTQMIREHIQQPLNQFFNKTLLDTNLATLYGMGFFQLLHYDIQAQNAQNTLVIYAEEPSWGPNFFKLKFDLASNFYDTNIFNLGFRHTYMPANSMGGEWRNEFQLGDTLVFHSAYYQPLNNRHEYFLKPFAKYKDHVYKIVSQDNRNLFSEFRLEQQTISTGLNFGYNFSTNLNISAKIYSEMGEIAIGPKSSNQTKRTYQDTILALQLAYDTLNQAAFPDHGTRLQFEILNNRQNLIPSNLGEEWQIEFSRFFNEGRHTVNTYLQYSEVNKADPNNIHTFKTLGGFQRLSGFADDALFGSQLAFGRLKYQYRLSGDSSRSLNFPLYIGATLEAGNVYDRNAKDTRKTAFKWDNTLKAGSLYLGLNSFLGPVYFAYGYHDNQNQSLYLYFGKEFY